MVEMRSPLVPVLRHGLHGRPGEPGVVLSETQRGSIVQLAAWPFQGARLAGAVEAVAGVPLPLGPGEGALADGAAAFGIGRDRFLVVHDEDGLAVRLSAAITSETGTVTDLSHGRIGIRVAGPKGEWVLSKFFAIDFSRDAFPLAHGRSTVHHDIFAAIQRSGVEQFDLYVFRSFARSFWQMLCHASEEVGYAVE